MIGLFFFLFKIIMIKCHANGIAGSSVHAEDRPRTGVKHSTAVCKIRMFVV